MKTKKWSSLLLTVILSALLLFGLAACGDNNANGTNDVPGGSVDTNAGTLDDGTMDDGTLDDTTNDGMMDNAGTVDGGTTATP